MKNIFLIEDDDDIRFVVEYILTNTGYHVHSFENASRFLGTIKTLYPDLILLDIRLPDGDGQELCTRIKSQKETYHIPIILMSAHAKLAEVANKACADGFIQKPFDINDLLNMVQRKL